MTDRDALRQCAEALRRLYEETADYITINHLGNVHHNASMQMARAALALPAVRIALGDIPSPWVATGQPPAPSADDALGRAREIVEQFKSSGGYTGYAPAAERLTRAIAAALTPPEPR